MDEADGCGLDDEDLELDEVSVAVGWSVREIRDAEFEKEGDEDGELEEPGVKLKEGDDDCEDVVD